MRSAFVLSIICLISTTAFSSSGGAGTVGPGNPAAIFCLSLKGKLQNIRSLSGDEDGLCVLGEARVEEWTLYGEMNGNNQKALAVFAAHPAVRSSNNSNLAAKYCEQVAGKVEVVTDSVGNKMGFCKFSDRSEIEVWTLYRGPDFSGNQQLTNLINDKIK